MKIRDMLKRKKKEIVTVLAMAVILAPVISFAATSAPGAWRGGELKSTGRIVYEKDGNQVVIDSKDVYTLANAVDELESTYKTGIANSVNALDKENRLQDVSSSVGFGELQDAITTSQRIPDNLGTVNVKTDGTITTDSADAERVDVEIAAAEPNNLSAGTAAWVDGELIVGTGEDNNSYYTLGVIDGLNQALDNLDIEYNYHKHLDVNGNVCTAKTQTVYGGCYTLKYSHKHGDTCYPAVSCHTLGEQKEDGSQRWHVLGTCPNGHTVAIVVDEINGSDAAARGGVGYCKVCPAICGNDANTYFKLNCGKTETSIDSVKITF